MKRYVVHLTLLAAASLLLSGCYTKLYRPGMELAGRGPYDSLYQRYDSTAIDTTLTAPEQTDYYPNSYPETRHGGWSSWGRPRTRWGFDFYNYDPGYYWSYYGYYDYYSVPWWHDWYRDGWWYGGGHYPGGPGVPEEPRDRGRRDAPGGGGGSIVNPPPSYPTSPPPAPSDPPKKDEKKKDDDKKDGRGGRRGR